MGRPSKEPPSPSSLVPAILRHARARGFDVEGLAWRFDLPATIGERDDVNAAADTPNELLAQIAHTDPGVAFDLAAALPSRHQALVAVAVRASATSREALMLLARWTRLLHEGLDAALETDGGGDGVFVVRTPRRPRGLGRYVHELALAYALCRVREGAGDDVAPARVWFSHARPPDLRSPLRFFGTSEIDFGRDDSGMAFSASTLARAMRAADARTVEAVVPLVDAALPAARAPTFSGRVSSQIASALPGGCDARVVARALHMSARTLQRRLEQEDTRFSEVLDATRLDLSRRWLSDPGLSLGEIAERLGFADLATFSRAFKRWTGRPPGQWRRS